MIFDLIIIVILVVLFLSIRREQLIDLVASPYIEGVALDLSLSQMKGITDAIKGTIYDFNFNKISQDNEIYKELNNYKEKLDKEDKELSVNYAFNNIQIIIDLINDKAKNFIDPELDFLNNQHDIEFLAKNGDLVPSQNTHPYKEVDSFVIKKKNLQDDACSRFKIHLKIKKKFASTYFLIEMEYDIYLTKYIRILNVTNLEKRGIFELQNQIALNNLDLNCIDCKHKKPELDANKYEKSKIYEQIKEQDSKYFTCSTKDTNNERVCASKEILADNTILEAGNISRYMCVSDYQCPMWRANKNYPNNRGGCVNGICEFPIGLEPKGSTDFNRDSTAVCHSRKTSREPCSSQLSDPKLASPDYAFEGDFNERLIYNKHLKKRGLRVQNLISK